LFNYELLLISGGLFEFELKLLLKPSVFVDSFLKGCFP